MNDYDDDYVEDYDDYCEGDCNSCPYRLDCPKAVLGEW